MQKKNSGNNVRSLPQPSAEQQNQNAKTAKLNEAMQMQASFFTLRAQLFNTIVQNQGKLFSAVDIEGAHALAHEAAKHDLLSRIAGARDLLTQQGEKFIEPACAEWLRK